MTVKNHSKQIVSFALMPVCGAPNGSHALHMHVFFIQLDLNPKAMMFCRREQVIVNFEPRLFFHSSIDAAKIGKKVETAFRPTLKKRADRVDEFLRNNNGGFTKCLDYLTQPFWVFTL